MKIFKRLTKAFVTFILVASFSTSLLATTDKELIQGYIDKGIEYGSSGQLDKAIKEFEKILKIDPNNVDAFNNLGVAYFRLNDLNKSLYYHTKAVEIDSTNPMVYFNRGLLLGKYMHQDSGAIADYTKSIELEPKFVRAYLNRAIAYSFLKENEKALSDYNKIAEISPDSLKYIIDSRAKLYFKMGKYEAALQDIEKSKELGVKLDNEFIQKVNNANKNK